MTGLELLASAVVGYLVRRARGAGGQADTAVDRLLRAGMDELHQAVTDALGEDSSLARLEVEAADKDEVPDKTVQRVRLAVEQSVEDDHVLAEQLRALVDKLTTLDAPAGGKVQTGIGVATGRDLRIHAESGGVATVNVQGSVNTNTNPSTPGSDVRR